MPNDITKVGSDVEPAEPHLPADIDSPPRRTPPPTLRDWGLLAVGVTFVLMGLVLLPSDRDTGIVTVVFFGACTAVFANTILRKYRFRGLQAARVELTGGVPIRPSRAKSIVLALSTFGVGLTLVVFGRQYGEIFWYLSWLIAASGGVVFAGTAIGWLPSGYVQFDPAGITFGARGYSYLVPWDNIAGLSGGDVHDNPALFIWLRDPDRITANPPALQQRMLKTFASNQTWVGAPIYLLTATYGLDLPLLVQALERYRAEPSARVELTRRRLPGA